MIKEIFFKTTLISSIILMLANCSNFAQPENEKMDQLKSWMTGSFSSQEQSEADTNFFHIQLEMVQIWKERNDAIWLYVEQAAAWSLDKPYRQRVYRLEDLGEGKYESAIFSFNDPLRFAGNYNNENPLGELTPDSLNERSGCAILLELKDNIFEGSTDGKKCTSQLRGSTYATSAVRIEEFLLTSWDRGFDSTDVQVWGADTGPYIFKKLKNYE